MTRNFFKKHFAIDENKQVEDKIKSTLNCLVGSKIEAKLKKAFDLCNRSYNLGQLYAWKRLKRNNFLNLISSFENGCPSYDDIIKWVKSEYSADLCVLQNIQWLDSNENLLYNIIDPDVVDLSNKYLMVGLKNLILV